jgi:hypothetical protein
MTEQMTDIYGVPCDVSHVRTFRNKREMGVGYPLRDVGRWFVYDRDASSDRWHMHCGPYSTFEQGVDWIKGIRDGRNIEACLDCGGSGSLKDMTCCPTCGGGGKEYR